MATIIHLTDEDGKMLLVNMDQVALVEQATEYQRQTHPAVMSIVSGPALNIYVHEAPLQIARLAKDAEEGKMEGLFGVEGERIADAILSLRAALRGR